ncbi:Metallo-hydrolase/oxidoreductase [Aaosphaeria arxii CBS 175.79]|uniref:Metallo-hydrolase/oxidoreductase n=1 Tax=Aaosphaeria arxii CBS 175.79 TaxID=1450172 RepID=A0A6A5Y0Y3_9PLEO|nr:Metallo-hydrolase/oxidoreductase [Aaosphaeria arxii CBS 175.79]KAF2018460.1 Metallo-hydrolase/oxidoreductase [Aaosphaeria arxii CBS 175.79]
MSEPLKPLPTVEKLSSRVIRVLGGNPGKFTLQGTNTYIVGTGKSRLLIDTGEGKPEWISALKKVLDDEKITIEKALLSHWHGDHIQGVPDLLNLSPDTEVHKNDPVDGWLSISDGEKFETEGATLRAHFCPGHTKDHMAFVLEEDDAMFTADNVLGQGTAVFEDLGTYLKSLEGMAKQFKGRAYPGHGPVIEDGPAKIAEYIKHRKQREQQVLDVLGQKREAGWTAMDIVKVIYKDYPENLWEPAKYGVLQILDKLEKEGKVKHDKEKDTWRLSETAAL